MRRAPEAENPSPIRRQRVNQQDTIKKSVRNTHVTNFNTIYDVRVSETHKFRNIETANSLNDRIPNYTQECVHKIFTVNDVIIKYSDERTVERQNYIHQHFQVQSNNMFGGLEQNPFFKLAESFLRTPQENSNPDKHAEIPQFQLKDFIPTADNNFGIPKGEGTSSLHPYSGKDIMI